MIITPDVARRARLAARCPHCRAAIGARCVVPSSSRPLSGGTVHQSRVDALTPRGSAA